MHEFKIVREEFHETYDDAGKAVLAPSYTFHVSDDGGKTWFPSMKWYPECKTPGLPKTYFIDRCVNRLKAGRSSEAFGPVSVLVDGQPVAVKLPPGIKPGRATVVAESGPANVEMVKSHGGGSKPRERRKGFKVVADGVELSASYPTEAAARSAAAVHCFLTRNKLGRVGHALEKLKAEFPSSECKVWACAKHNGIRATVDGKEYSIGWVRDSAGEWTVEKFKQIA